MPAKLRKFRLSPVEMLARLGSARRRIKLPLLLSLVVFAALLLWILTGDFIRNTSSTALPDAETVVGPEAESEKPEFRVRAIRSIVKAHSLSTRVSGVVEAERIAQVAIETQGRIQSLNVKIGDRVTKGDVLLSLSTDARQQRVKQAKSGLDLARIEYRNQQNLSDQGLSSGVEDARALSALETAQLAYDQARLDLTRSRLQAPFSGEIASVLVEVGEYVSPGRTVLSIVDYNTVKVIAMINERHIGKVKIGGSADVDISGVGQLTGTVQRISPVAEPMTKTYRTELAVANEAGQIKVGQTASIVLKFDTVMAHFLSSSLMSLDLNERLGVKIIDAPVTEPKGVVRFVPVEIIADTATGSWVLGLDDAVTVIAVGQDQVDSGETIAYEIIGGSQAANE